MFRLCIWWVRLFPASSGHGSYLCTHDRKSSIRKHPPTLRGATRRGGKNRHPWLKSSLSAHPVRFPAVRLLGGCVTTARFTLRCTGNLTMTTKGVGNIARKNANKETSNKRKNPVGRNFCTYDELWSEWIGFVNSKPPDIIRSESSLLASHHNL